MHDDDGIDDSDRKLLRDVEKFGWHVVGITADAEGPAYAFSVGLEHTLRHPEVCVFGLPHELAALVINEAGNRARAGRPVVAGVDCEGFLEGFPVRFQPVPSTYYRDYFGYARWFYHGNDFRMLQCVWPDKSGRWPWESNFNPHWKPQQPLLT